MCVWIVVTSKIVTVWIAKERLGSNAETRIDDGKECEKVEPLCEREQAGNCTKAHET